jgi:plasmid stabilization system protein ParE
VAHRVSPQAEADLDRLWFHVASEASSLEVADRLIDSISQRFFLLSRCPQLGRRRDEDLRAGLRSFPGGEHIILYRIDGEDGADPSGDSRKPELRVAFLS